MVAYCCSNSSRMKRSKATWKPKLYSINVECFFKFVCKLTSGSPKKESFPYKAIVSPLSAGGLHFFTLESSLTSHPCPRLFLYRKKVPYHSLFKGLGAVSRFGVLCSNHKSTWFPVGTIKDQLLFTFGL